MPEGRNPLWSGTLTFGLVSLPVTLAQAIRPRRSPFHLIHSKDNSRLSIRLYCPKENVLIHPEHIQRGFEVEPEKYVIVTDEEIESVEPRRSKTIEIRQFLDSSELKPDYYDTPYYLVPRGSEKPYQLLVDVLGKLGKAGVAEFVMQAREHLCAVQSINGVLCLFKLRYPQALRKVNDIAPQAKASAAQVDAIESAVKKNMIKFDPDKLKDQYQENIDKLIGKKRHAQGLIKVYEDKEEEASEEAAEGEDLTAVLEESLAREKKRGS